MNNILSYFMYFFVSLIVTVYVGYQLHRDGRLLLIYLFKNIEFVDRLNNILLLGYYLVNIGYVFYAISSWRITNNPILMSLQKISVILLILGYLHYQNIIFIYLFFKFKLLKKWKL